MEGDERLELANLHLFIAGVGSLICLLEYVLSFETFLFVLGVKRLDD